MSETQRRLSIDVDDLGLAVREIENAIGEAAGIEAPLRRALALSGHDKDILGDLSAFKDVLRGVEKAIKARMEEATGLVARVEFTDIPSEDEPNDQ